MTARVVGPGTPPAGGTVPEEPAAVYAVRAGGLAGAAGRIAALTTVSRIVGFARIFVFTSLIGITDLGDVYQTVNTLPNIAFEILAGGTLAMVVVPLLSDALARGDEHTVSRTSSALLTWTVAVLAPLSVLVALLAHPIVAALPHDKAAQVEVGARMLTVFAPQLVLYGVGIVLTGVLQAHRRFSGPAVAPLLSSVTVMAAYGLFALVAGYRAEIEGLSRGAELVLSVGTTAGVAVLSLSLLIPLRATRVRLRPSFRFPPGVARRLRALVGGGVVAVIGQQLALLVALVLCQPTHDFQEYTLAQTMFLLPWAVLAVPVATSAFPRLAAAHVVGDSAAFRSVLTASTRSVLLLSAVGAAALVAAAEPIAHVIVELSGGDATGRSATVLAAGIAAFAPGLPGYALLALISRALYAAGAGAAAAAATVGGWCVVIAGEAALAALLAPEHRVAALAAGSSAGLTVLGIGLVLLLRRRVGALPGFGRAAVATLAVMVVGSAAGLGAGRLLDLGSGVAKSLAQGMLVGVVVLVASGVVAAAAYPRSARSVLARGRGTAGE